MPSIIAAIVAGFAFAAPTPVTTPDLSGDWTLVAASGATAEAPPADTLSLREVEANSLPGLRMPPGVRALVIERRTGTNASRDTVRIGIVGGVSGSVPGAQSRSEQSVRWTDGHLVVWQHESVERDGQMREHESTEDWSLDASGQLVLTAWSRRGAAEPTRVTATYRRK